MIETIETAGWCTVTRLPGRVRSAVAERSCARACRHRRGSCRGVWSGRRAEWDRQLPAAACDLECGDVFIKPLGFVLADELVEHLGHLGGAGERGRAALEDGWRPEDVALLTTGTRHPEQKERQSRRQRRLLGQFLGCGAGVLRPRPRLQGPRATRG